MTVFYTLLFYTQYNLIFKTLQHCFLNNSDDKVFEKSLKKNNKIYISTAGVGMVRLPASKMLLGINIC